MNLAPCYRVNSPQVASEIIDGEAIMIHFEKGCYFSTEKLGAAIVEEIAAKRPVSALIDRVAIDLEASHDDVADTVASFIERLCQEELIVPEAIGASETASELSRQQATAASNGAASLEVPTLHKYTDLEDLLLLDPIHDIDATGWPMTKAQAQQPEEQS